MLSLGSNNIVDISLGNSQVVTIHLGDILLWEREINVTTTLSNIRVVYSDNSTYIKPDNSNYAEIWAEVTTDRNGNSTTEDKALSLTLTYPPLVIRENTKIYWDIDKYGDRVVTDIESAPTSYKCNEVTGSTPITYGANSRSLQYEVSGLVLQPSQFSYIAQDAEFIQIRGKEKYVYTSGCLDEIPISDTSLLLDITVTTEFQHQGTRAEAAFHITNNTQNYQNITIYLESTLTYREDDGASVVHTARTQTVYYIDGQGHTGHTELILDNEVPLGGDLGNITFDMYFMYGNKKYRLEQDSTERFRGASVTEHWGEFNISSNQSWLKYEDNILSVEENTTGAQRTAILTIRATNTMTFTITQNA